MYTLQEGYRGLSLLVKLNWDRIAALAAIILGLSLASFIGTALQLY